MQDRLKFYIDGQWVDPVTPKTLDVINPSDEEVIAKISMGSKADVDKTVAAARRAFDAFSVTSKDERVALLEKIVETISLEMGAPLWLSKAAQAATGIAHLKQALLTLKAFEFETVQGSTGIVHEPVGVVGMITPWNWPINQIMCKVAPALAAGCTMVLKPTEVAPLNALLLAEVLHEAGVPPGVFNLVNGDGPTVGEAMSAHPGIDMMSFTGSTRAGIAVAKAPHWSRAARAGRKGMGKGYFVRPTVFADVTNEMTIAREEIFGPVLVMLPYDDEEDAIRMANDTPYGLSGYVQSESVEHARKVASRLRTGNVHSNGAGPDFNAPFGGYKQSGTGREWGDHGFREYLEVKAVMGWQPA